MFGRNVMPTNGRPKAQTEGVVQAKISIAKTGDSRPIDAKSVINLSTMQIIGPANIIVYTVGPDAEKAAQEICKCIEGMSSTRKSATKQST